MKNFIAFSTHLARRNRSRSTAAVIDYRSLQGPWLTRGLIEPDRPPVFVIDYKDLIDRRAFDDSPKIDNEFNATNLNVGQELLVDFRQIASFNWFGNPQKPIMIIPGAPRQLRHSWAGGLLDADNREQIIADHLHMTPKFPMESMFLALQVSDFFFLKEKLKNNSTSRSGIDELIKLN